MLYNFRNSIPNVIRNGLPVWKHHQGTERFALMLHWFRSIFCKWQSYQKGSKSYFNTYFFSIADLMFENTLSTVKTKIEDAERKTRNGHLKKLYVKTCCSLIQTKTFYLNKFHFFPSFLKSFIPVCAHSWHSALAPTRLILKNAKVYNIMSYMFSMKKKTWCKCKQ